MGPVQGVRPEVPGSSWFAATVALYQSAGDRTKDGQVQRMPSDGAVCPHCADAAHTASLPGHKAGSERVQGGSGGATKEI